MRTIQVKCDNCGANMFLEEQRGYSKMICPYCNGPMKLLMESDRVKIAKIRANTDRFGMALSYKKHRNHLTMDLIMQNTRAILISLAAVLLLIIIGVNNIRNSNRINVPCSSRDLNNKTYQVAQMMLEDAGFSDIEIIAKRDLWDGFLHNDQANVGKVAQVTINGYERFKENDSYDKGSKVRIWYHAYP